MPPIQSIEEIITIVKNYLTKYGGNDKVFMREVGVFSHAGTDGPMAYNGSNNIYPLASWDKQMSLDGWAAIDFNWRNTTDNLCVFYGCNTASKRQPSKIFAKNISNLLNFNGIEVWGQSTSSYPSFLPDIRMTSMARNANTGWNMGPTYMVAGNPEEGRKSTQGLSLEFPKANNLNAYKNGSQTQSNHQGIFNDHRKT